MQNTEEKEPAYEKIREINYETIDNASGEKRRNLSFFIILLISFGFFAAYFLFQNVDFDLNTQSYQPKIVGSEVHIELSKISTKAQFFQYNSGGTSIKYFVVIGSDDGFHIAFDACDVCYESKKGYSQNGNKMHCNNC
ncbi:MAG: Fe-S-containing protein, partial [Candidatus Hodarchaeota archaeon]